MCPNPSHLSHKALLAGFLLAWLKRCAIPSPPIAIITPLAIFLAIQLVYGRLLGLLPAMIYHLQSGLWILIELFYTRTTSKKVKRELVFHDRPSPRVELSYAYPMAWFTLYCPVLIQPRE